MTEDGEVLESPACIVWTQDDRVVLDALANPPLDAKSLELRSWTLDDTAVAQLQPVLTSVQGRFLRSLRLENSVLSESFVSNWTSRFAAAQVELTQLRVTRCLQLGMTSLIAVSGLLTPSLVTLELSKCQLPRQAGILLGQSLQSCTALRHLLLADNNLRDGGLRAVSDAVKLAHASRNSAGVLAVALGSTTATTVALEQLDVSRNGVSSAGLACLAQLPVRQLSVEGNAIEYGVGALLVSGVETLETLYLEGNPLSEDGQQELVRALFRRRDDAVLRQLDIRSCGFGESGGQRVLLRGFQRAVAAGERCSLEQLVVDVLEDAEEECCEALQELIATGFPRLKLCLESDAEPVFMAISESVRAVRDATEPRQLPRPLTASNVNRKLVKVATLSSPMRLNAELEAVARDAKASVQASLEAVAGFQSEAQQYGKQQRPELVRCEITRPVEPIPPSSGAFGTSWGAATDVNTPPPAQQQQQAGGHGDAATSVESPPVPLQHAEVEFIVSKTIECMNQNFEQRLGQFLTRMETQQHERTASQVQVLAAKVEACERALPRLEARLDVLADRVSTNSAQMAKLQTELQLQLQQLRSDAQQSTADELSTGMRTQVETLVEERLETREQQLQAELARRAPASDPRAVVDAVSRHLTQFKREFDAQQTDVLRQFSDGLALDGRRVEERVAQVETQIAGLEGVIQAEQQASLLALEAISEAFGDPAARKAVSR